jgi:hypothetical protein
MANTKIFELDSQIFTSDLTDEEMVNISGGALAPTCLDVDPKGRSAYVTNECGSRQRVKLVFAFGRDSECIQLEPGGSSGWKSGIFAQFDRLETC